MGLGPDLSLIKLGAIFSAADQSKQAGGNLLNLSDRLSGVQTQTALNWQGLAGAGFSLHVGTRVQAKQLTGQALQHKGSALNTSGASLQKAVQQWESGKNLLSSLPAQLKSQALSGSGLSAAGLGITDPAKVAALLAQAGAAVVQLVEAQAKAQAAGLQLVADLQALQPLIDEAASLVSGNQSQAKGAPVASADAPPWLLPVGLGAGGLGSMVMPLPQDPPIEGDPIPEPLPPILGDPIPEPGPPILGDPIPEPLPPILGDPIPVPVPPIAKNDPGKKPDGEGEGQAGQGELGTDGKGQPGQGGSGQRGQGQSGQGGSGQGTQGGPQTGSPPTGQTIPDPSDILMPNGQPVGNPSPGGDPGIRQVPPGDIQNIFQQLIQGGTPQTPGGYSGQGYNYLAAAGSVNGSTARAIP